MIKNKLKIFIIAILLINIYMADNIIAQPINNIFLNISAEGAVLIDVNSGRILYEKNSDKKMRIASLTKIMTAIIAIENGKMGDVVTTSDNAFGTEGSSIYLKKGEKLTLNDMLYGLMLRSGNDAAVAISEHIGGSIEGFSFLMNRKAAYIGMTNSHFTNPHGLDNDNHYSTPFDIGILTAYALKNQVFKEIVNTKLKTVPVEGEDWVRKWVNKNKLLYLYEWADGVKTGYTKLAKRCLASSATKDGLQLACVTLNAPDDWNDHKKMFEYGFNTYKQKVLVEQGDIVEEITIEGDKYEIISNSQFIYPLKNNEDILIKRNAIIYENLSKFNFNNDIGKLEFYLDNIYIGSVTLKIKENDKHSKNIIEKWREIWEGE
ncbi:MAG: D-alanyl-D-alanine carboxypeptidase family protein [Vulcanibacillus sp.]